MMLVKPGESNVSIIDRLLDGVFCAMEKETCIERIHLLCDLLFYLQDFWNHAIDTGASSDADKESYNLASKLAITLFKDSFHKIDVPGFRQAMWINHVMVCPNGPLQGHQLFPKSVH